MGFLIFQKKNIDEVTQVKARWERKLGTQGVQKDWLGRERGIQTKCLCYQRVNPQNHLTNET